MPNGPSHGGIAAILINETAGRRGRAATRRLEELLRASGSRAELHSLDPERLPVMLAELAASGEPMVGVGGGDGTIAGAAAAAVGTQTAILPLPIGTLNHFARRLGIGTLEEAVAALDHNLVEPLSVGILDDRIFLNTVTVGPYADAVRLRDRMTPILTKWPAAILAFAIMLARLRRFDARVSLDGQQIQRSTPLIWIGVGTGSFPRVTGADEGLESPGLEVVVLRSRTQWGSLALLGRLIRGLLSGSPPTGDPALEILEARELVIHSPHRMGLTLDGEVACGTSPIFVSVQREALRVVCPGSRKE